MNESVQYSKTTEMNFGEAIQALKNGKKVTRSIWGGYWYLCSSVDASHDQVGDTVGFEMSSMIVAVLKDNGGVAPAQPYQSDILAEDWQIVD